MEPRPAQQTRSPRPAPVRVAAGVLLLGVMACGVGAADAVDDRVEVVPGPSYTIEPLPTTALRLDGATKSLDALIETVETAITKSDSSRLFDLMITESEYRTILYPAFPAAHPPINASFETIWVTHFGDAYRGMVDLVKELGGRDVEILAIRFDHPDQDFVNFTLHEMSRVDVVIDDVRYDDVRLFGSVVEIDDQWKVLSYPDR